MPIEIVSISRLFEESLEAFTAWDFDETHEGARATAIESVPGRLVAILLVEDSEEYQIRLGRLLALVAKHCLPCWSTYSDSARPFELCSQLVRFWFSGDSVALGIESTIPIQPTFHGKPIVDCTFEDTTCVAKSMSYAAKYAFARDRFDAICSLGRAWQAFDVSPFGGRGKFEKWLLELGIPCALNSRIPTAHDSQAYLSHSVPAEYYEQLRLVSLT